MNLETGIPFLNKQNMCEVCLEPLTPADLIGSQSGVCRDYDCRRIIQQRSTLNDAVYRSIVDNRRRQRREFNSLENERESKIAAVVVREGSENDKLLRKAMTILDESEPEKVPLITIPTGRENVEKISGERLVRYKNNLEKSICAAEKINCIEDITSDQNLDSRKILTAIESRFSKNQALRKVSDKLCVMCKGGCCNSGKDHAYLSVYTLKRFMIQRSDLSSNDVFDLYFSKVSDYAIVNSCINQTEKGCTLPREMRSDICNSFYCAPIKAWHAKVDDSEPLAPVVAVQREHTYSNLIEPDIKNDVIGAALVTESGIRSVELDGN